MTRNPLLLLHMWLSPVVVDPSVDLAILELEKPIYEIYTFFDFDYDCKAGEMVCCIGHPDSELYAARFSHISYAIDYTRMHPYP